MFGKNKKTLLLLPVLLLICAMGYYFLYWCRTPLYAVNEVRDSVKNHDVVRFEKYVDLHSVIDKAFEDIIVAESKINNDNLTSNPFAMGILHMLKPSVVDLLVEEAKAAIADNKEENEQSSKPQRKTDPITDAMRSNIEKKIYIDKLKVDDIELESTQDNEAVVALTLKHKETDQDFILKLKMLANDEGIWQIKGITNLVDFIVELDAAQKKLQTTANKPLLEKISKSLVIKNQNISVKSSENKQNKLLSVLLTVENTTDKVINRVYYDVEAFDKDNTLVYSYPEHFNSSIPPHSTQLINNNKQLRPNLPADDLIITSNAEDLTWKIHITYLGFADGEVLDNSEYQ